MPLDDELLASARALSAALGPEVTGIESMSGAGGTKHLLEVKHVPNIPVFPGIREVFPELAAA